MKSKQGCHRSIYEIATSACGLLAMTTCLWAQNPPQEFRIIETEGPVGILSQGATQVSPVKAGISLVQGDRLITGPGGRVQAATRQGTVVELQEKSIIKISTLTPSKTSFFLRVGRFLGRFAAQAETGVSTQIKTPVAVASVRGTELAMVVDEENREVQAGVIEGAVGFKPELPPTKATINWSEEEPKDMEAEETDPITIGPDKGLVLKDQTPPQKINSIPPLVINSVAWFPSVRERIPALRSQWKEIERPERLKLRERAFREQVKWVVPKSIQRDLKKPRQRLEHYQPKKMKVHKRRKQFSH